MSQSAANTVTQPGATVTAANHDEAIERIIAHMETLKASPLAAGDEALLKEIDVALSESLERYCEAKRAELAGKLAAAHAARRK